MLSSTICGDARDGGDRVEGEPVPGVHLEAGRGRGLRGALEPGQLALQAAGVVLERALAIGARVQLDHLRAEPRGRLDGVASRAR